MQAGDDRQRPHGLGDRVVIDDEAARENLRKEVSTFDDDNLPETGQITGADPAYVMFTSGSTGEPKGAVIPHQGVLNLVEWAAHELGIGRQDRLTNVNPIYFDNSVFDIYAGLLNGAAIVALDALRAVHRRSWSPRSAATVHILLRGTNALHVSRLDAPADSGQIAEREPVHVRRRGFPIARLRRFHEAFAGKRD